MTGFPINPPRAAIGSFQDRLGQKIHIILEPEWYRYFAAIQKLIGGPSDPFEDTHLLTTFTDPRAAVDETDLLLGPAPFVTLPGPLSEDDMLLPPSRAVGLGLADLYDGSTAYVTGEVIPLSDGGTGASLADPNADRVLFWDDSAGQTTWLTMGTSLSITTTTLNCAITTLDSLTNVNAPTPGDGQTLIWDDSAGEWVAGGDSEAFVCDVSRDETTALTTGTGKYRFRFPYPFHITGVRASVATAPTGDTIIIDVNLTGVSVFSTRLTIDATETTSTTAATPYVFVADTYADDDEETTIDIDQIGSGTAGAGLKVYIIGQKDLATIGLFIPSGDMDSGSDYLIPSGDMDSGGDIFQHTSGN